MKNTLRQVFHSGKFVAGFSIFSFIVLTTIIYPLFVKTDPLAILSQGTFFPPGIYVSAYDTIGSQPYTLFLDDASAKRVASKLSEEDGQAIKEWLVSGGIAESEIDTANTEQLLDQWVNNFDPTINISGMTNAKRNYYVRLNTSLKGLLDTEGAIVALKNPETGAGGP